MKPIRVKPTKDGGWFFYVVADNGETLAHSQVYTRMDSAMDGARALLQVLQMSHTNSWKAFIEVRKAEAKKKTVKTKKTVKRKVVKKKTATKK